ncbi:MAG: carbohydrate kinase family protein, partial [Hyphomicrobiaceae bacterium]
SKTEAAEISTHCGGGAVNTAVALARLGLDVTTIAKLGRDARAETIMAGLIGEGVSTRWVSRDPRAPTGASVLVSSHDRNAAVFTFRGANTLLEERDLRDEAFAVDLVYITSLSNQSAECFPSIIAKAKAAGAMVCVNPGPRQLASRGAAFECCLADVDVLSINRAEAAVLMPSLISRFGEGGPELPGPDLPRLAVRGLAGSGFVMSLARFMSAVLSLGPGHVLLTDGMAGAYLSHDRRLYHVPSVEVEVAGTAGAGDAFSATFAAYVARGAGVEDALRAATLNGASVVAHIDTQTGLLRQDEIDKAMHSRGRQVAVRSWDLQDAEPLPAVR